MSPSQIWYCRIYTFCFQVAAIVSTLLLLCMTFKRLYSIIKPHKAASVNTVKRAKITILCITTISIIYNAPSLFLIISDQGQCFVDRKSLFSAIYYWVCNTLNLGFTFCSLLTMNCIIIHKLRKRPKLNKSRSRLEVKHKIQGQNQHEVQGSKLKNSDTQIYILLLLVTFSFLILNTPGLALFICINFYKIGTTPQSYAGFFLFTSVANTAYFANFAINFYLYVLSGHRFRADLTKLFSDMLICFRGRPNTEGNTIAIHNRHQLQEKNDSTKY